jgi:hypothetical protein
MMMVRISQVYTATASNADMLVFMTGAWCEIHDADVMYSFSPKLFFTWNVAVTFGDAIFGVETGGVPHIE